MTKSEVLIVMDCEDRVALTVAQVDNTGEYTLEELAWISNAALAIYCYDYTMQDGLDAQQ